MATKAKKGTVQQGTVQGLVRGNGEWLAVVAAFSSRPGEVVMSRIVRIEELRGSHRKKAERWAEALS